MSTNTISLRGSSSFWCAVSDTADPETPNAAAHPENEQDIAMYARRHNRKRAISLAPTPISRPQSSAACADPAPPAGQQVESTTVGLVHRAMRRADVSLDSLATAIGISTSALQRRMNGAKSLTVRELWLIARALDCRAWELVAETASDS
jgi:DNA-binding Xre family transcriptional regulator